VVGPTMAGELGPFDGFRVGAEPPDARVYAGRGAFACSPAARPRPKPK
jgi:hypothetical protein